MNLAADKGAEKGKKSLSKEPRGLFLLFETTHMTMKAERILKGEGIPFRLFPKPKSVLSECGIIVKVFENDLQKATRACDEAGLKIKEVLSIP